MDATGHDDSNRAYYDAFSERYEHRRGHNDPGGYHEMLDVLEAELVERYGTRRDVLEVGCGTGLVLERIGQFAGSARGVDLSPKMLERARERGLDVVEGSATELPFDDASFDVTCSFKVLAHVPDVGGALAEMARVTRPGGVVIAELYNAWSLRALVKRLAPPGEIADEAHEHHVYTRYHTPREITGLVPPGCRLIDARGIRIVTPAAFVMKSRLGRRVFYALEEALCDSPLRDFGGFYAAVIAKRKV